MKRYFIDTNIFLRTIVVEDKKQLKECYRFLNLVKFNKVKAVTDDLVLAEVVWVLQSYYKLSRKQIVEAVKSIINLRGLKINKAVDFKCALDLYGSTKVKFIDSAISSIKQIRDKKWTVVSYDKDFDKLGVIRKEPADI